MSCEAHAACWGFGKKSRGWRRKRGLSWGQPCQMHRQPDTAQSLSLISPSFFPCPKHSWPWPSCSLGIQLLICEPKKSSQGIRGPVLDTQEHRRMLGAELNPLTWVKWLSGQAARCWQVFGYCCVPNVHQKSQRTAKPGDNFTVCQPLPSRSCQHS